MVYEKHCFEAPDEESALDTPGVKQDTDQERDPDDILPGEQGAKLDAGKTMASLLEDFSLALMAIAKVGTYGAEKYSPQSWQHVKDGIRRYKDAGWRHKLNGRYEELDSDSGLPHAWHEAWNALAVLELKLREEKGYMKEKGV